MREEFVQTIGAPCSLRWTSVWFEHKALAGYIGNRRTRISCQSTTVRFIATEGPVYVQEELPIHKEGLTI